MASSGAILELHHHPILPVSLGKPTREDYDDAFELQTILAIKEPRLTLNSTLMTVKVDSLTDVVVLEAGDESLDSSTWMGKDGKDVEWVSDSKTEAKDTRQLRERVKQVSRRKAQERDCRTLRFSSGSFQKLGDTLRSKGC